MTMHWWFIMSLKPKSAYENMWIYYTIYFVSRLHVSVTYCGHLQVGVFQRIYYKEHQNQFANIKHLVLNISFKIYIKIKCW